MQKVNRWGKVDECSTYPEALAKAGRLQHFDDVYMDAFPGQSGLPKARRK